MIIGRRGLILAGAGISLSGVLPDAARAQVGQTYWPALAGPASSPTTTFDPAHAGTGIVFSNGNLTAVGNGLTINFAVARSVASHSSGKYYAEFTINFNGTSNSFVSVGLTTSSATLNTGGLGTDANLSLGTFGNETQYNINNSLSGTTVAYTTSDVVEMATDAGGALEWMRVNGGDWNGSGTANPAAGIGGFSFSAITGPYYAAIGLFQNGGIPSIIANFGGSTYAHSPPIGYGNW